MTMTANTKKVFEYLQKTHGSNVTAKDIAAAFNGEISTLQVNGIFTSAIARKNYGVRVPAEIELPDGTHAQVKFLTLTDEGMAIDLDSVEVQ